MMNNKIRNTLAIMIIGLFVGLSLSSNLNAEPLNSNFKQTCVLKKEDSTFSLSLDTSTQEIKYGIIFGLYDYNGLSFSDGWYYFEAALVRIRPLREIGFIYSGTMRVREDGMGRFGLIFVIGFSYFELLD